MQGGFARFLQQVGLLFKLFNLYKLQKYFIASFYIPALKSPIKTKSSYFEDCKSRFLLIIEDAHLSKP